MSHSPVSGEGLAAADEFRASWQKVLRLQRAGMSFSGHERDCFFLNTGGSPAGTEDRKAGKAPRFAEISAVSGFDDAGDGRGVAVVDWDHDGDLDLWLSNRTGPQLRFYRNDAGNRNHFVAFKLDGDGKRINRDGIGARVEVVLKDQPDLKTVRTLRAGEGFVSQATKWVYVGLGKTTAIEKVAVRWPDGTVETFSGVEADKHYRLALGSGKAALWAPPARTLALKPQPLPDSETSSQVRMFMSDRYPMPRIDFKTFDGKPDSLGRFKGKPVLVNLWASWCPPCMQELAEITREEAKVREAGLTVLALSLDEHTAKEGGGINKARAAVARIKFPFDVGLADFELQMKLDAFHKGLLVRHVPLPVPTSFLLDAQGRLAVVYRGKVTVEQLLADVKLLSAEPNRWFELALPLPGRSFGRPSRMGICDVLMDLVEEARFADVAEYLEDHGSLIALRYAAGHEPKLGKVLFALGIESEQRNQMTQALAMYQQVIELQPKNAEARYNNAVLLAKQGRGDSAIIAYKDLLEIDPRHIRGMLNLGVLYAEVQRPNLAIEQYEKLLALAPDHLDALNNCGNALVAQREPDKALAFFAKALKLSPGDARTHYNLGTCHDALKEYEKAAAAYEQAVKFDPKHAVAYNNLGVAYARLQRWAEAEAAMKKAIELDPDYAAAKRNLQFLEKIRPKK